MWLINTESLKLEQFFESLPNVQYAILSHTWGSEDDELTFDEFQSINGRRRAGFKKIQFCCRQARKDGLPYAWVDTCCIDKRNNVELSEAINSMFNWYRSAAVCYIYLEDVLCTSSQFGPSEEDIERLANSRWFTRGWTLQELIAPPIAMIYDKDWSLIGSKSKLAEDLQNITGIDGDILTAKVNFLSCSIAARMSWASKRQTKRIEDSAYCLLGLFDVSIPLLYGEGAKAFLRLQKEIIKSTDDETIFAWSDVTTEGSGLLAPDSRHFTHAADIQCDRSFRERPSYTDTNRGLSLECQRLPCAMNTYVVPLRCSRKQWDGSSSVQLVIFLGRTTDDLQYRRVPYEGRDIAEVGLWDLSEAKVDTVAVPDKGFGVELLPYGGLPTVRIQSSLDSWFLRHSDVVKRESPSISPQISNDKDLEGGSSERSSSPSTDVLDLHWEPVMSTKIQFRDQTHDLRQGVVLAFSRTTFLKNNFNLCLQIGFDIEFRPVVYILTTQPFGICRKLSWFHKSRFFALFNRLWLLPAQRSFWRPDLDQRGKTAVACRLGFRDALFRKHWPQASMPLVTFTSWRSYALLRLRQLSTRLTMTRPYNQSAKVTYYGNDGACICIGGRATGCAMNVLTISQKPQDRLDLHIKFRPLADLTWQLDVTEERSNIIPLWYSDLWVNAVAWLFPMVFLSSLFLWILAVAAATGGLLSISAADSVVLHLLIPLSPLTYWPVLTIYLLNYIVARVTLWWCARKRQEPRDMTTPRTCNR